MENIKIIEVQEQDGSIVEHIIIDRGNGEYTSMTKAFYYQQQAALSTPNLPPE